MSIKKLFGCILTLVGILICFLSGGCTVWFLAMDFPPPPNAFPIIAMFGGIPFISGIGLWALGRKLRKPTEEEVAQLKSDDLEN